MAGRGRPKGSKNSELAGELKATLLRAVIADIAENPSHAVLWAEKLSSSLLPKTVEGTGENGELTIKVVQFHGD